MLFNDLEKLEAEVRPIRIGVSGAGWIGSGFVHQVSLLKGMKVDLLADEGNYPRMADLPEGLRDVGRVLVETAKVAFGAVRLFHHLSVELAPFDVQDVFLVVHDGADHAVDRPGVADRCQDLRDNSLVAV